jgi:hypothetical protein
MNIICLAVKIKRAAKNQVTALKKLSNLVTGGEFSLFVILTSSYPGEMFSSYARIPGKPVKVLMNKKYLYPCR